MRFPKTLLTATTAAALFGQAALAQTHWVGTWGAAPSPQLQTSEMESQKLVFHDQTESRWQGKRLVSVSQ